MPGPFDRIRPLVHKYTPAPPGFDPSTATNRELCEHGLTERPDPGADPALLDFWQQMHGPGTAVLEPQFPWDVPTYVPPFRAATQPRLTPNPTPRVGLGHHETSGNWSGAYMTPIPRPNRFVRVMGSWTVPAPSIPGIPPAQAQAGSIYRSSTWLGTGGHRSYNSLPQIGTSQDVSMSGGTEAVSTGAWWQWWIKDRPQHDEPVPIVNFEADVGDQIFASVTIEAPTPGEVRFNLKNQRTGKIVAFKVAAPADILPLGTTAEWVHERPTHGEEVFPLPRCTDVVFNHCLALNAHDLGATPQLQTLENQCRLIRMSESFAAPSRAAYVSTPMRNGTGSIRIVYQEAGT